MAFNPNVAVDDMVVLVVDKIHPRKGSIGRMLYHDWREYGGIEVQFADGHKEEFYDGIMNGDPPCKISRFYRHVDDRTALFDSRGVGPRAFITAFRELEGNIEKLSADYRVLFGEDFPDTN